MSAVIDVLGVCDLRERGSQLKLLNGKPAGDAVRIACGDIRAVKGGVLPSVTIWAAQVTCIDCQDAVKRPVAA